MFFKFCLLETIEWLHENTVEFVGKYKYRNEFNCLLAWKRNETCRVAIFNFWFSKEQKVHGHLTYIFNQPWFVFSVQFCFLERRSIYTVENSSFLSMPLPFNMSSCNKAKYA